MSKIEFTEVNVPQDVAEARTTFSSILQALKKLGEGRALAISIPEGRNPAAFRNSLVGSIRYAEIGKYYTQMSPDHKTLLIWKQDGAMAATSESFRANAPGVSERLTRSKTGGDSGQD